MRIFKFIKSLFHEKILFADLDGTIIVTKSGKTFPIDCKDWQFKDGIIDALRKYKPTHLFIVSNQGGIEGGVINEDDFIKKLSTIERELRFFLPDIHIESIYEKSNDKSNSFRKPNTGMLEYFYHDYIHNNDFCKRNALMIGDASGLKGQFSNSDYECARRFGIKYVDVDYFVRWGNPCNFCELYHTGKCKYTQDQYLVGSFPCDADISLSAFIEEFKIAYESAKVKQ